MMLTCGNFYGPHLKHYWKTAKVEVQEMPRSSQIKRISMPSALVVQYKLNKTFWNYQF